jgi:hypothetical protein
MLRDILDNRVKVKGSLGAEVLLQEDISAAPIVEQWNRCVFMDLSCSLTREQTNGERTTDFCSPA